MMMRIKLQSEKFKPKSRGEYRRYTYEDLEKAYNDVKINGISIRQAARAHSVPSSTLQDRVDGKVDMKCMRPGPDTVLSQEEEQELGSHVDLMSSLGFGYTRLEVANMATNLAVSVGKRSTEQKPLTLQWYHHFRQRWPKLNILQLKSLKRMRATATSPTTVDKYFNELGAVFKKYKLESRPETVHIISEKGFMEQYQVPKNVSSDSQDPKSRTTTVIACCSALGIAVPPFFIFEGDVMGTERLSGATTGTSGAVSNSGSSNSELFTAYLETHFLRYAPPASADQPILILYDGYRSDITLSVIKRAFELNIILFSLPAYMSTALDPVDDLCFGPFEEMYNDIACERPVSDAEPYSFCEMACRAYLSILVPISIQAAFKKCGLFPLNRNGIKERILAQSAVGDDSNKTKPASNLLFRNVEKVLKSPKPKRKKTSVSVEEEELPEEDDDNFHEI